MAADSMQTHLLRLQEIMAKSAAATPAPKTAAPSLSQQQQPSARPQQKARATEASLSFTEWRPALKHVNRLVAQNPDIETSIRKLITEHREHEQQWWNERQKTSVPAELKDYDLKVYKAQKSMQEYMSKQLHALEIPFFAVPGPSNLSSERLLELQRQMLEYLESAYGPD